MQVLVDADACPVRRAIVEKARARGVPVIMLADTSHMLGDGYSTVITVDKGRDSVDIRLANLVCRGDIVVTQDFGVAAMALGKGAFALAPSGMEYTAENIDRLLFERHLGQKARRAGKKTDTMRKRTKADDTAFVKSFCRLLEQCVQMA